MVKLLKTGWLFVLIILAICADAQVDFVFSDAAKPDSFAIPFQVRDSLIRVRADVNGRPAEFVLDNGCPYLVINSRYWQSSLQKDSAIQARGVGGAVNAGFVMVDSFNWQGIQKQHFKAVAAELPHLGDSICGLMGLDLYKDYRVLFDFEEGLIRFTKPVPDTIGADTLQPVVIPFAMSRHLPVITGVIEQQKVVMGIDCAAMPNLIGSRWLSMIKGVTTSGAAVLTGGGAPVLVTQGSIQELLIDRVSYKEMKFTFDDSSLSQVNLGRDTVIDGLLGIPFLKQYRTVIDFPNRRLEIYKPR